MRSLVQFPYYLLRRKTDVLLVEQSIGLGKSNLANFRRKARIYRSVIGVNVQCEECGGMVRVVYNFQFSSKTAASALRYYYMKRPVGNPENYNNGSSSATTCHDVKYSKLNMIMFFMHRKF